MGNCMSDVKGGKQAIVGVGHHMDPAAAAAVGGAGGGGGPNDVVDLFCRTNGLHALYTPIELSLSASKLRDLDIVSKSVPMAVVCVRKRDGTLEELGRTEVIMNNLDAVWIQKIHIMYQFETVQTLIFHVYDIDTKYHNLPVKDLKLKDQDFLGEGSCVLSEIVTKRNRSITLNLHNRDGHGLKNLGKLTVLAEETVTSRTAVEMTLRCTNLENKDLFSKSDPFLRISRIVETGGSVPICKTEVVNDNLYPIWKPVCLTMQQFVNKDNPLVIECFDFNSSGNHVLIGKLQKTVADLENMHKSRVGANFISPPSGFRGNEKVLKGQLFVEGYAEKQLYSFLDYISSGFELSFMVAVDFTVSACQKSFVDNWSMYLLQAIMEVGDVIQFYDSDKRFPAWGFGGRAYSGTVSHCFNLAGSPGAFEVDGVGGIMAAYASALQNFTLSGPTLFGHVVNKAAEIAAESLKYNQRKYFVLLIITDGVLTDMQETKDALVRASDLPLSILIVGVGSADFTQMEILDADNGHRLESSIGRVATRDIVQFVPMREVHSGQISVVQALLEELPGQFLAYMRCRNIRPHNIAAAQTSSPGHPMRLE
ncbi:protein bonzai 3 [Nicotiana attenuata]|uniref:Protein bonzai 3 n=1 Tax=Nicotiana attenuata TaxID=49451 RepID=A0A314LGJ5_NICAT|nr:protein bonzai 3 [Nicotiana attenuata]